VSLLQGIQVLLARLHQLLFVFVPVTLEFTNVLLLLLEQLVHLNIVLGKDGTALLVVFLVTQFFNL